MFSICLCSWNDLAFLKILHRGIVKNTKLPYELIVHDNGSTDGTLDWLKTNNIKHTYSDTNEGVAAVNHAVRLAEYPYIIDINSDMYPLPGWDMEIFKQIQKFKKEGIDKFTISATLIEPLGNNPEYTIRYYGHTPQTFNEEGLLQDYFTNSINYAKMNATQYSHPIVMPKDLWNEMGGVDVSYKYGIGTDHDIPASAYKAGCRNFIMLGRSRVYHFVSQTIRKLPNDRPDGQARFKEKWGMTVNEFRKKMNIAQSYRRVSDGII